MGIPKPENRLGEEILVHPHMAISEDTSQTFFNGNEVDEVRRFTSLEEYLTFSRTTGKAVLPLVLEEGSIVAGIHTFDSEGDDVDLIMERDFGRRSGEYTRVGDIGFVTWKPTT